NFQLQDGFLDRAPASIPVDAYSSHAEMGPAQRIWQVYQEGNMSKSDMAVTIHRRIRDTGNLGHKRRRIFGERTKSYAHGCYLHRRRHSRRRDVKRARPTTPSIPTI